jgi:AcrR family transcriptional regulator
MGRLAGSNRLGDRATTEAALEDAALTLLERDGVLSGLNLQEVADAAGVNRGLVYHYFGSRRTLLRRALRRNVSGWMDQIDLFYKLPVADRVATFLQAMVRYPQSAKLVLLLAIDGDHTFRMPGDAAAGRRALERDVVEGRFAADVDGDAFNVLMTSVVFSYAVRRRSYAKEVGIPVRDLDRRVEETLTQMIEGLCTPRSGD